MMHTPFLKAKLKFLVKVLWSMSVSKKGRAEEGKLWRHCYSLWWLSLLDLGVMLKLKATHLTAAVVPTLSLSWATNIVSIVFPVSQSSVFFAAWKNKPRAQPEGIQREVWHLESGHHHGSVWQLSWAVEVLSMPLEWGALWDWGVKAPHAVLGHPFLTDVAGGFWVTIIGSLAS